MLDRNGVTFTHSWATRLCRENPWWKQNMHPGIKLTVSNDEIRSRPMFPIFSIGWPDIVIKMSQVVRVERETYPFLGKQLPTVKIYYTAEDSSVQVLEHALTNLLPFLVTRRRRDLISAIQNARRTVQ